MKKNDVGGSSLSMEAAQLLELQELYTLLFWSWGGLPEGERPLPLKQLFIVILNVLIQNLAVLHPSIQKDITAATFPVFLKLIFPAKTGDSYQPINRQAPSLPQPIRRFLTEQKDLESQIILLNSQSKVVPYTLVQHLGQQAMAELAADSDNPVTSLIKTKVKLSLQKLKHPSESTKIQALFHQNAVNLLRDPRVDLALGDMQAIKDHLMVVEQRFPNQVLQLCGQPARTIVLASTGFFSGISNWWNATQIGATKLIFKVMLLAELSQDVKFLIDHNLEKELFAAIRAVQADIDLFLAKNSPGYFSSAKNLMLKNLKAMNYQLQAAVNELLALNQETAVEASLTAEGEAEEGGHETATSITRSSEEGVDSDEDSDCDEESTAASEPELPLTGADFLTRPLPGSRTPVLQPQLSAFPTIMHIPSSQQDRLAVLQTINAGIQPKAPLPISVIVPQPAQQSPVAVFPTPAMTPLVTPKLQPKPAATPAQAPSVSERGQAKPSTGSSKRRLVVDYSEFPVKKLKFVDSDEADQAAPTYSVPKLPVKSAQSSPKRKLVNDSSETPAKRLKSVPSSRLTAVQLKKNVATPANRANAIQANRDLNSVATLKRAGLFQRKPHNLTQSQPRPSAPQVSANLVKNY